MSPMMELYKHLKFGILIALAAFRLVETSLDDQSHSPLRLNVPIASIKQWLWKAGELATLELKDDSAVAQYTWTVKNILDKITKANHTDVRILSPPFYTDVLGYRLRLSLDLYYSNTSYIGLYVGVIKGQFDDLVSWPFDYRYELSSAGPDGTTFAHMPLTPANKLNCNGMFNRPTSSASFCGYSKYMSIEKMLSNGQSYLVDGALNITFNVYLED